LIVLRGVDVAVHDRALDSKLAALAGR